MPNSSSPTSAEHAHHLLTILPCLTSICLFSTGAISNLLHAFQSPMQSPTVLPLAAAPATSRREEREAPASGYPTHSRACCPSMRRPRLISPLRLQPTYSPFSGTSALQPVPPQPPLAPDSLSLPHKRASPAPLTRGSVSFNAPWIPAPGGRRGNSPCSPPLPPTLLFPFCLQISLLSQSLSPTPGCHSSPPTSYSCHQLETSTPGSRPSTPIPATMCQQDGHCTNNISACLVLKIFFWGSLFHCMSATQIHGQLPDFTNRNHTSAKILNSHTPHSNTPSHPFCSCALSILMAKNSLPVTMLQPLFVPFCSLLCWA